MKLQKETKGSKGHGREHGKWYGDACGTAFALELIGERWSLLIVRELMLGARRFSDLRASLPGISAKVLTERLEGLEEAGVLVKRKLPPPAAAQVYELTEWGYMAEPAIQELGRWAARSPGHNPALPLSPVSLMLSMRTMLDREAARPLAATMRFEVGEDAYFARLADGELAVARAAEGDSVPDFTVRMNRPLPYLRVAYGKQPLDAVEAEGELTVTGDRELARKVFAVFSLPPKCA
ncbi:MAG: winged helix-turn-helix transcriptional regulator [Novosphingobium sp.]|nr:winged helix-turn-helix transcriptional regulator [Novosphingobium sp.]